MKYTQSMDGVERCSINIEARLTKEDVALLNKVAKAKGFKSVKEYLNDTIPISVVLWEYLNDDIESSGY